jgi:hypothetical protein
MLQLSATMSAAGALSALARLDLGAVRFVTVIPGDALAHEAVILSAASPVRTGALSGSYVVRPRIGGAQLTNSVSYFAFNLFGTGRRGTASGVRPSLFGATDWKYGPRPGMPPWRPLITAWGQAPDEIARFSEARLATLF